MKKIIVLILAMTVLLFAGCGKNTGVSNENPSENSGGQTTSESKDTEEIVLYYPDSNGEMLCTEKRTVSVDDSRNPEAVLGELIKGTTKEGLENVIPDTVKINSCITENNVCIVDLSAEFISIQGTASQEMAMYSVVNTLCGLEGVEKVQFLIEGEKKGLFGNYDFASPFEADMSFVKAQ